MRPLYIWAPPLLWLALILAATSIPNLDTSHYPHADKVFHLGVYAVWTIFCLRAIKLHGGRGLAIWLVILAIGIAVAVADELHEKLISGQTVSFSDFICNTTGFLTACSWDT